MRIPGAYARPGRAAVRSYDAESRRDCRSPMNGVVKCVALPSDDREATAVAAPSSARTAAASRWLSGSLPRSTGSGIHTCFQTAVANLLCRLSGAHSPLPWFEPGPCILEPSRRSRPAAATSETCLPREGGASRTASGDLLPNFAELSIGPVASDGAALRSRHRGTPDR